MIIEKPLFIVASSRIRDHQVFIDDQGCMRVKWRVQERNSYQFVTCSMTLDELVAFLDDTTRMANRVIPTNDNECSHERDGCAIKRPDST
jgi:hypothetical protein